MSTIRYHAFGLTIDSEIGLIDSLPISEVSSEADISIRRGKVPDCLASAPPAHEVLPAIRFQAKSAELLLTIDGVARYLVRSGNEVIVDPAPDCDFELLRLFLAGSALGAVLFQRRLLPLHGSAVAMPQGAILFCGASGHGKSTLAAAFGQQGYPVVSDDVSAIQFDAIGTPRILPASPRLLLWRDALDELQLDVASLCKAVAREDKFQLPVSMHTHETSVPLLSIFLLEPIDTQTVSLHPLTGFSKIKALIDNTYRLSFVGPLGLEAWHFRQVGAIAEKVRVVRAERPANSYQLQELVSAIKDDLEKCS